MRPLSNPRMRYAASLPQVGAAAGAAASAGAFGTSPRLMLGGAAAGTAIGVLAHVTSNRSEVVTADNVPVGKDALPK